MGKPVFTSKIPTAAVQFDKEGNYLLFLFNEEFWNTCDEYKKMFVICHESLHIILNHGKRFIEKADPSITNVAMDLVINHSLVRDFGFDKAAVDEKNEYCWIDTIFKDKKFNGMPYPDDETSEFYYNEIKKTKENCDHKKKNNQGKGSPSSGQKDEGSPSSGQEDEDNDGGKLVDQHGELSDSDIEEVLGKIKEELTDKEKLEIDNILGGKVAGKGTGFWDSIGKIKALPKAKWETVITKWKEYIKKLTDAEVEQWARKSRRMNAYITDMILPHDAEIECIDKEKGKIDVYFFLDTSGSCYHLKERFFIAARSLPEEKFNVRLFCFDTKAEETTLESGKVYGGGGTSFTCIEEKINECCNNKYPSAVFIITDGMGTKVSPKHPERWHWFLSENYRKCIPNKSKVFDLNDFE